MKVYSSCVCDFPLNYWNSMVIIGFQIVSISKFSLVILNYSAYAFAVFVFIEICVINKEIVKGSLDFLHHSSPETSAHGMNMSGGCESQNYRDQLEKKKKAKNIHGRAERREKRTMAEVVTKPATP